MYMYISHVACYTVMVHDSVILYIVCRCDIHLHEMNCMSITQVGWTPLITAADYGKCDVVMHLLSEGAVVDAQNSVSH